jgi:hypothetical protein
MWAVRKRIHPQGTFLNTGPTRVPGLGILSWMSGAYWNPLEAVATVVVRPGTQVAAEKPHTYLRGTWEDRNWRNAPGPFYGAETDTCGCGVPAAPANVLCDDLGQEFVWRQPQDIWELQAVLEAASHDPFDGYAMDGDDHWTPSEVRQWWAERHKLGSWIDAQLHNPERWWTEADQDQLVMNGLRRFHVYLGTLLSHDLRVYIYWLEERRAPSEGARLPTL